jgi:hypothetical protein
MTILFSILGTVAVYSYIIISIIVLADEKELK